jgi:hypothetical protein
MRVRFLRSWIAAEGPSGWLEPVGELDAYAEARGKWQFGDFRTRAAPETEDAAPAAEDRSDMVATVATVAVVGVAALAFEAALLPGIVLGVAAVAAPKYVPKLGAALNPLFRSAVRGSYKIGQKTKEMLAEAHEQVNDIVAEVHAEGDVAKPASKSASAG